MTLGNSNKSFSEANNGNQNSNDSDDTAKARLESALSLLEQIVVKQSSSQAALKQTNNDWESSKREVKELKKHNLILAERLDSVILRMKAILGNK